ncbi:MAG: 7,8-dihydropterin-6-yl-methyl-4-(beta-D-ribofuranosyl)aminobenzene 5-phosphate synthase [Thermosediminibacterales bacterium]|nr:7,8-dihydropterin-6-yl-methyl-4-(beta-D-ribofuranosyl)aminobenzene 5-phosphate synthase [Thermosediminibacterales bacterium]MDK2835952.1 7,8-dihydropterin-6-yl-methyl-4-(beta-D-ribofuranosyl)aminobenzene 5-phosphate synthase [Thermosediminibacterales bacterium]
MSILSNIGEVDCVQVTPLLDDYCGFGSDFLAQHGISILIDVFYENRHSKRILLDTGNSAEIVLHNMELINIDPKTIDMIFLSHCHYDHTGGLIEILKTINKNIPVVAHPQIFRQNYKLEPCLKNIGLKENAREEVAKAGGHPVLIDKPFNLMPGVISTGEVERVTGFEGKGIGTYNIVNNEFVPDLIIDDMALIINIKKKGLLIVSGCSHSGIVNIVKHSIKITGIDKIHGIMGGLHLVNASDEVIDKTVEELIKLNPEHVVAGHCTGLKALAKLMTAFRDKFSQLSIGRNF